MATSLIKNYFNNENIYFVFVETKDLVSFRSVIETTILHVRLTMRTEALIVFVMVGYVPVECGWFTNFLDKVCPIACPRVCTFFDGPITSVICKVVCTFGCGSRVKRHIAQATKGHIIPLANRFDAYDINDDGYVTKKELCIAISDNESNPHINRAFKLADRNNDGKLTSTELFQGPFVFEMDYDYDNIEYCERLLTTRPVYNVTVS
ncbi:hypothetical protein LOTGIDRAFT_157035 [Lottia gigantea]|uniref:EF-hand domain-containing protein n=1 Tax=Lottia gigantea TaxID=225164 RepID=V4AGA4_LOTGI|nr:hypothetical protein LOTGIDRAFT_157035 [Lottia gigantea]ESP03074.1 hypothetical protein LOTGIDRAFT_157035 [Lottia gigantea]